MGFSACFQSGGGLNGGADKSESDPAPQQLDDADSSFFGVSDGEEETTAKKSKK